MRVVVGLVINMFCSLLDLSLFVSDKPPSHSWSQSLEWTSEERRLLYIIALYVELELFLVVQFRTVNWMKNFVSRLRGTHFLLTLPAFIVC